MKKLTTLFLLSIFCAAGLFAQKAPVVGTVNVQRVLNDFSKHKAAVEKIRGAIAPVEEEMQRMQQNIERILTEGREVEARANNAALSDEARQEAQIQVRGLQEQLQQENVRLQQFRQQAQALAQKGQKEDLEPLQEEAVNAVRQVAQDKGIDLVLPLNTVIFADDALEITDAVIAVLNAK